MNEIKGIRLAIKLFYIVLFVGLGLLFPIKGLFAFMESDLSYLSIENYTSSTSFWVWSVFVIKYVYTIISLIGVSYLIKTLNVNEIKDIFSTNNIQLFRKSGKFFHYAASVGSLRILIRYINGNSGSLKLSNDFITLLYFLLLTGFFFMAFSKVLEFANDIQKENDLTI